jgi:serine O-acetyltransferase
VSAFTEDLKRWSDRTVRPVDGTPLAARLSGWQVARLMWRHPPLWATAIYRTSNWCHRHGVRLLPTLCERLNMLLFGLEISPAIPIGPGFYIAHPYGTVIQAARVGANASFIHSITVGMRGEWEFPTLCDGVFVGAGARVLGAITLGDGCSVGANAVVMIDVPAGMTAVGVPAVVREPRRASHAIAVGS